MARTSARAILLSITLGSLVVFTTDLMLPLGVATAVGYVGVVWVATRVPDSRLIVAAAVLCTALTFLGYMVSLETAESWKALANRGLAIAAIWLTALLSIGRLRSEDQRRQILDWAPMAFVTVDDAGVMVYANYEASRLFGYGRSELVGRSVDSLVPRRFRDGHPDLRARFAGNPVARRLGDGQDIYAVRKDGTEVSVEIALSPFRAATGLFVLVALADVSERRRAERTRAQLAAIVDSSDDAIIGKNLDGTIVSWNRGAERLYGYTAEEAIGRSIEMLAVPESPGEVSEFLQRVASGESVECYETLWLRKDGSTVEVSLTISPIPGTGGEIVGASAIARDITERRRAERESADQTLALAVSNQALKRSNEDLRDFGYVVSHDLKAPLRSIASLATWIHEDHAEHLDDQGRGYLEELVKRVQHMSALIDGVLTYSRATRAEPALCAIDSRALVESCVEALNPPESIRVEIGPDLPVVRFDEAQLLQVFQNLIGNAIRHIGRPEGLIVVSCMESPHTWEFSVRDDGVGIAERNIERIFKLFQTVEPRDDPESTGIGLTVVKKIVERAGGEISVTSAPGEGADFRFSVPRTTAPDSGEEEKLDA